MSASAIATSGTPPVAKATPQEAIIILETDKTPSILKQFCQAQANRQSPPVLSFPSDQLAEGIQKIQAGDYSVVIICLAGNEGLSKALQVLALLQKDIQNDSVKIIAINRIEHPKVISTLKMRGCFDVTDERLNVRALQIKIQRALEILTKIYKRKNSGEADVMNIRSSVGGQTRNDIAREAQWSAPLECAADCWLIQGLNHTRFVLGQWMIGMLGPGPSEGTWEEEKRTEKTAAALWKWTPRDAKVPSSFHSDDGQWYFSGKSPEFDWKMNVWRFLGKKPELYFLDKSGKKSAKLLWDAEEKFCVAKNSTIAEAKRDLIIQTIEASIQIRNQHIQNKDSTSFETDALSNQPDMQTREALGTELNYRGANKEAATAWNNHLNLENQGAEHRWDIGAKAFSRTELSMSLPGKNLSAELIETEGTSLTLEVPTSDAFETGQTLQLVLEIKKFDRLHPDRSTINKNSIQGVVLSSFKLGEGQTQIQIEFKSEALSLEALNQVQEVQKERQESILEFFKSAR